MSFWRNTALWLHSLAASVIGAAAGAVPVVIVDPEHFNFQNGWRKLASVVIVSAVLALAMFLKQHPVPDLDPEAVPVPVKE